MPLHDLVLRAISEVQARQTQNPPRNSLLTIPLWTSRSSNQTDIPVFMTLILAMENLGQDMTLLSPVIERGFQYISGIKENLRRLQEEINQDVLAVMEARADLRSKLWTKLGGYSTELDALDRRLEVFRKLSEYREQTLVDVGSTLRVLRAMSTDSANLRQRWVLQSWTSEPLLQAVLMQSLRTGLERLEKAQAHVHVRSGAKNSERDRDSRSGGMELQGGGR